MAQGSAGEREGAAAAPGWPRLWPLLALLGFFLLLLVVYRPALQGPFVSDDHGYIVTHPYTQELSRESIVAILDPFGPARLYAANYAPVHLLLTALEKQIFADHPLPYHLVNLAVHALACTLLLALLLASGVDRTAASLGALLFALHPANVEAVAWVSQLKTNAALVFSLAALLAFRRHPAWATTCFALGLLTKASAAFALPTAAACWWAWGAKEGNRRLLAWLALWALLFVLYAIPQFGSFAHLGEVEVPAFENPWVQLRTMAAVGARYLVMAASSYGVSAFQEPEPVLSPWDPWWLLALPLGALLSWRLVSTLRRRRLEGAWWVAAAAAFAPVSQLFPFLNPVADRYLYFLLPGLLGGLLLATQGLRDRLAPRWRPALALAVAALAVFFGAHSARRAALWRGETYLLLDAARHYPRGGTASYLRARSAAQRGDAATAVSELRWAADHGIDRFMVLDGDPSLAPIRDDPAFRALVYELAGRWIERARRRGHTSQAELHVVALAHWKREEYAEAERILERALAAGGPLEATLQQELESLRAHRRAGKTEEGHLTPKP